ncbi:zinc carboxypeptidase-like [Sitodiplosis mosellana]|uniref:zinc carboxypeptidase-like n=1 Tax=Sitodiplosis mosellana TaxID=263140 RepID=UPI0024445437|nr:zinc carboxypeptidase-like [Sitodiplosis mosellana]
MKLPTLAIFVVSFLLVSGEKARFDNYRVYSLKIQNEKQLEALQDLENFQSSMFYLEAPISIYKSAEIIVPPHKFADIADFFDEFKIENVIRVDNLQKLIDEEQPKISPRGTFGWDKYYDLPDIYNWLDELLQQYPDILTNYDVGTSYKNRTIRAVKLSKKKNNSTVFIESTIHAREWISVATATYILNALLTSNDPEVQSLAQNYDWIIVPVLNVDGFAYTHSNNRLWRKTRQPYGSGCVGADPNRNFDFHHNDVGSSSNPCSEIFAGPKPFSEPEALALSKFVESIGSINLYIAFHSYSQLLMFPYGHTTDPAPNHDDMLQIGEKTIEAIAKRYGTDYKTGDSATTIYLTSGSSVDWAYRVAKVPITYTFEFRDKGQNGFILPADQIIPNSEEILDGLVAMVKEAKELNYL